MTYENLQHYKTIFKDIKEEVIKEAIKLREFATAEEKQNLDFTSLEGESSKKCIYGQMTGNCFSERASELIRQCNDNFYSGYNYSGSKRLRYNENEPSLMYLHDDTSNGHLGTKRRSQNAFTAIETYLLLLDNKNSMGDYVNTQAIINFIKGDRETLTVDDLYEPTY